MNIKEKIEQQAAKFDKLQTRERALIVIAVLFIVVAGLDQVVLLPMRIENKTLQAELDNVQSKITMNRLLKEQFESQIAIDPNAREETRLQRLKTEMTSLDAELAKHSLALISPQQMVQVLRDVVNNDHRLELVSLRSLGGKPVLQDKNEMEGNEIAESADDTEQMPNIYRHGLELKFRGEYFAVLAYLKKLESLKWRFYWDSVQIQMERYPAAMVTVRLDTLSFVDAWIGA